MSATPSQEFKFRIDEEPPEQYLPAVEEDRRIRKFGRRINWFAFLICCLFGALLATGYFDLRQRMSQMDRSGLREMAAVTKDLQARLSTMTEHQAALKKSIEESRAASTETIGALRAEIQAAQAAIQPAVKQAALTTRSATRKMIADKVDRLELDRAVARLEKSLDPLQTGLKAVSAEIGSLDQNLTRELAAVSSAVENLGSDLAKVKRRATAPPTGGGDSDYLDARMRKEQRIYQLKLDQAAREIEKKLAAIDSRLNQIEQSLR